MNLAHEREEEQHMPAEKPSPPRLWTRRADPQKDPPDLTVPIEGSTDSLYARRWARSTIQTALATALPAWKLALIGLVLLGALTLFGLNAALLLAAACLLSELVVIGWGARRARRRGECALRASPSSRSSSPASHSPAPEIKALGLSQKEKLDLQRWEGEGGATAPKTGDGPE